MQRLGFSLFIDLDNTNEPFYSRWLRLRSLELKTADGLPPLPMHLSWVRDGIFVIGMDNEMQVFSQWKDTFSGISTGNCGENAIANDSGKSRLSSMQLLTSFI